MADSLTVANNDLSEIAMFGNIFADRAVNVGAGETLAKNTALAVLKQVAATAGTLTTVALTANVAALIAVSDGEFTLTVDGGTPVDVTGIDMSSDTDIGDIVATLDAAVTASGVTVTEASGDKILFTSDSTGASSSVVIEAYAGSGTDIVVASMLNIAAATSVDGTAIVPPNATACESDATDGSDYPRFILMQELDNSDGQSATTFNNARVMLEGEFDAAQVVFDNGTDTLDTVGVASLVTMRDAFKTEGLIAIARNSLSTLDNQ